MIHPILHISQGCDQPSSKKEKKNNVTSPKILSRKLKSSKYVFCINVAQPKVNRMVNNINVLMCIVYSADLICPFLISFMMEPSNVIPSFELG